MSNESNICCNNSSPAVYDSSGGDSESAYPSTAFSNTDYTSSASTSHSQNGSTVIVTVESLPLANLTTVDISIMIMALATEGQETGSKTAQIVIKMKQGEMVGLNSQAMEKIAEALEAQGKAGKSGGLGKVFGWIGVAAAMLAAVVTMNPALMAVAVMAITMMSLQETGQMEKLAQEIGTEAFIALMVIIAIIMIAAPMAAPAAAGGAAGSTAASVSQAEQSAMLAVVVNNTSRIQVAMTTIEAGSSIASGAFAVDAARYQHKSTTASAESDRRLAESDRVAELVQMYMDFYFEMISNYDASKQVAYEIIRDTHETNKHIANENT